MVRKNVLPAQYFARISELTVPFFMAGMIQSVGCLRVLMALPASAAYDSHMFYEFSEQSQLQISIAVGFFVWDLIVCVYDWSPAFIAHGVIMQLPGGCQCSFD
jgi:hypothetical protein